MGKIFEAMRAEVDDRLIDLLTPEYPEEIYRAMYYSVSAGGKRLRPLLLLTTYEAASGREYTGRELDFACALEMIHTYSLIHDDLPAMDNDDYRRGQLTNHKVYGEAMALLAGDALLNKAFEVMLAATAGHRGQLTREVNAMRVIASASGTHGMIGGQTADILSEGGQENPITLQYIHKAKTGALIQASVTVGAVLAAADDARLEILQKAGETLGFAYQIKDDILDVTSSLEEMGKKTNSDERNHKLTYISVMGLEQSKLEYKRISEEAIELFRKACGESRLIELAEMVMGRTN